jgi:hypothetical protein
MHRSKDSRVAGGSGVSGAISRKTKAEQSEQSRFSSAFAHHRAARRGRGGERSPSGKRAPPPATGGSGRGKNG